MLNFIKKWGIRFAAYVVTYVAPVVVLGFFVPYWKTGKTPSLTSIGAFMLILSVLIAAVSLSKWAKENIKSDGAKATITYISLFVIWFAVRSIIRYVTAFVTTAAGYWEIWLAFIVGGFVLRLIDVIVHSKEVSGDD